MVSPARNARHEGVVDMSASTGPPVAASPDLTRAVQLIGSRALDSAGRRLGRITAVLTDGEGHPWWLVLRHWRRVLIAPVAVVGPSRHRLVFLACTRADLERAPQPGSDELTVQTHTALANHFGLRDIEGKITRA
jgi:hypothetical protein